MWWAISQYTSSFFWRLGWWCKDHGDKYLVSLIKPQPRFPPEEFYNSSEMHFGRIDIAHASWQNPRLKAGIKTIRWCCHLSSDQSPVCLINTNNKRPLGKMKSCIQPAGVVDTNNQYDVNTCLHVWITSKTITANVFHLFFIEEL